MHKSFLRRIVSRVAVAAFFLHGSVVFGGAVPENPLEMSDEMIAFFEQRVDQRSAPLRRLELIVQAIFREDGLHFTYEAETRSALNTFNYASGDCLSFTNLFTAVARHFGLNTRYREVEVAPTWSKRGKLIVLSRHINSVVYIGGRTYLIDLFPQVNRIEIGGRTVSDDRGFAHYYNNLGAERFSKGSPSLALEYFRLALEEDQEASFVWANQGVALSHLGLSKEAEESYQRAIKLDKHNMVAITNLAELYQRIGRLKESERLLKKAEDFQNKNPYYHYGLGEDAFAEGDYPQALKHYKDALKRKSKEHHFHHAMAKVYVALGDPERAAKHLEKAREYAPDESGRVKYSQKLDQLAAAFPDL